MMRIAFIEVRDIILLNRTSRQQEIPPAFALPTGAALQDSHPFHVSTLCTYRYTLSKPHFENSVHRSRALNHLSYT